MSCWMIQILHLDIGPCGSRCVDASYSMEMLHWGIDRTPPLLALACFLDTKLLLQTHETTVEA
jgi:hypothetical protein